MRKIGTDDPKYPFGLKAAYALACRELALLIRAGVPVFCPIVHMHGPAIAGGLDPLDHDIWLPADQPFMDAASGLIFLKAISWEQSYGMRIERERFEWPGRARRLEDEPAEHAVLAPLSRILQHV
jgi:hypothetical protein